MSTHDIAKQYINSQLSLNEIKKGEAPDDIASVKSVNQAELEAQEAYQSFKKKLEVFKGINSISEARSIAKSFLPIENEKNYLKIGNAKCVIISRGDVFRICLDSENEYICYNIIKPK